MDRLLYLLGPLGCAAMMAAMMWMMRGQRAGRGQAGQPDAASPEANTREEIAAPRAEVATPRAQQKPHANSAPTPRG